MEIWISGVVLISLHMVYAQRFQLRMQLTDYQSGRNIPNRVIFEACLRDSSTGCGSSSCSPEEAQSATVEEGDLLNTDVLIFPPILAGHHLLCFKFKRVNGESIVSSSTAKSITMTEGPDERTYVRSGSLQNQLIVLAYELQVLCSEKYFSPTCSTLCTPTATLSGDFMCSGDDGELICQSDQNGGPDLANCQEKYVAIATSTADEDRGVNADGLSQGAVAGIVVPILLITALVAAGAVAGILVWKYQPWHHILNKESINDRNQKPSKAPQDNDKNVYGTGEAAGDDIVIKANVVYGITNTNPNSQDDDSDYIFMRPDV